MLDDILSGNEGKTLEFKENALSTQKIAKTAVAFANTAGGTIVVGVEDKTKKVVGLEDILKEEERVSNLLFELIEPALSPDIDIVSKEGKECLVIHIPHSLGPYYFSKGGKKAAFIRIGSSNRPADPETLANLHRLAKRISFDEMACVGANIDELDGELIKAKLGGKNIRVNNYESLKLVAKHNRKKYASYGGLLLFGRDKPKWLPDAIVKCVAFASQTKKNIIDKRDVTVNLFDAIEEVVSFVKRNTRVGAVIGPVKRDDIPEYPVEAVREAVINAILHTDYSIVGASVQVSIYQDRIEIVNPGGLIFGQTMEDALAGVSKFRNPVIGRMFREAGVVETLGMGMLNIQKAYEEAIVDSPKFEELGYSFKVTLYACPIVFIDDKEPWMRELHQFFLASARREISTSESAELWAVNIKTARSRLNKLVEAGYLKRNATSKNDPKATYSKR